jgi:hypothetical protein
LDREHSEFVGICQNLGIACKVLDRRAIENYFTDRAVRAALTEHHQALPPFERLNAAKPSWSKRANWRIAGMMKMEELDGTDLGEFLKDI